MKNAQPQTAMAAAVQKAHAKADEKASNVVPHTKRSTDVKPVNDEKLPQELVSELSKAAQQLHDGDKFNGKIDPSSVPAIVCRTDLLNRDVVFLVQSHDRERDTIFYWDGVPGNKPTEVSVSYYKSTKPASEATTSKLVKAFSKEFGTKELIVRQRLIKNSVSIERDNDGKVDQQGIEDFKQKMLQAIEQLKMAVMNA